MQPFIADKLEEIAALCREYHVERLALFGSAAREDFDPARSDVDLLVEFGQDEHAPFLANFFGLRYRLEVLLGYGVDLIPDGPVRNPVLKRHMRQDRVELYGAT